MVARSRGSRYVGVALNEVLELDPIKVIRNEEYLAVAGDILAQARYRVDLCTFKFELSKRPDSRGLNSLVQILYALAAKKVVVRVLLNTTGRRSRLVKINQAAGRELTAHGLQVRSLPDGRCQHAKILLVDRCLGIIGSHNWSSKSMTDNFEVSVAFYGAGYLEEIIRHYEKIWETARKL